MVVCVCVCARVCAQYHMHCICNTHTHTHTHTHTQRNTSSPFQNFLGAAEDHVRSTQAITASNNQTPSTESEATPTCTLSMEEYFTPPKNSKDYDGKLPTFHSFSSQQATMCCVHTYIYIHVHTYLYMYMYVRTDIILYHVLFFLGLFSKLPQQKKTPPTKK